MYLFDPSSEKAVTRRIEGYSGHTHSVLFDAAGTLWIAGNTLMRYAPSTGLETMLFPARCSSLSCSPDGGICASTIGKGVVLFKDSGTIVLDKSGTGIQDDYTYLVEEVSDGVLLVGTDMGLSLVDATCGVCCNFNSGNGLSMNSTREGDILHRSGGEIWIGGVDGLVTLDRSRISLPAKVGPVSFESVTYGRQGDVTVEMSDFNYSHIVPSLYEYRLDGDASGWVPLPEDQILCLAGLKRGKHTLEVRAFRFPDLPPSVLGLDVPGTWFASPWMTVAAALLLFAAVPAVSMRVRRRREDREKEAHQKRVDALVDMTMGLHAPRTKTEKDSEFLLSVASVVEKHLSDEKMGVEMLCGELHLSRTMLDRKIKSITGDSPRAFIEDIRLTQAARLVRESGLNVSEIAYEMGYSSPKYFSIRFKNRYGMSPLAYRKMK